MKTRVLRNSQFGDYVAIDIVDESGKVLETPFYLTKGESLRVQAYDEEDNEWVGTKITYPMSDKEETCKELICKSDATNDFGELEYPIDPIELIDVQAYGFK